MKTLTTCLATLAVASVSMFGESVRGQTPDTDVNIPQGSITVSVSHDLFGSMANLINDQLRFYGAGFLEHTDIPLDGNSGLGVTTWLDGDGCCSNDPAGNNAQGWARFDFDQLYDIKSLRIYNYADDSAPGRSFKDTIISWSNDGGSSWTVGTPFELPTAPFTTPINTNIGTVVSAGFTADAVLVTGVVSWGDSSYIGLDEVKFNLVPEPTSFSLLGLSGLAMLLLRSKRS